MSIRYVLENSKDSNILVCIESIEKNNALILNIHLVKKCTPSTLQFTKLIITMKRIPGFKYLMLCFINFSSICK